jgi:hypothetical protein
MINIRLLKRRLKLRLLNNFKTRLAADRGLLESEPYLDGVLTTTDSVKLLGKASLILTPSGYKENTLHSVLPGNGNGDMTFVRATTATRVNSAGLIEDTPYNLNTYSEEFTNALYFKANTTVTANVIAAPNGTISASLVSRTATGTAATITKNSVTKSNTFTATIYAKLGTVATNFGFRIQGSYPNRGDVLVNLSNGTIIGTANGGTNTLTSASIISAGNGWYRIILTTTFASNITQASLVFSPTTLTSIAGFEASNTVLSNAYIWGAQLVQGDVPKDYFPTTTRLNVPRLNYDAAGGRPSILLEPQRTNSIRNSTMQGASVALNTIPTSWQEATNGLTRTVVGLGVENGISYIDIRFNGISIGINASIRCEGSVNVPAISGQTWNTSNYVKLISQPLPPTSYVVGIIERNSSGNYLSNSVTTYIPTSTLTRINHTRTLSQATTAFVQNQIDANLIIGNSYDFTIRIAAPQLEQGAYPTSYIPTVASTVTRNADVISKTGISSLIGQTEGVLFVESAVLANDLTNRVISISDGTTNNRVFINYSPSSNQIQLTLTIAGTTVFNTVFTVTDETQFAKIAARYSNTLGYSLWINGASVTFNAETSIPPSMSRFGFDSGSGFSPFFGKVKQVQLYKTYLTDTECINLTTL